MKPILYLRGDATTPHGEGNKMIAHVCNDIGKWGAGFVVALSKRSRRPEQVFRQWYAERQSNDYGLGAVQFVQVGPELWVANMIGQHTIRIKGEDGLPPVRYEAIEQALGKVAEEALAMEASVHMPRIGCGLAGGKWELIEPLILKQLCERDVQVTVYDWD